MRLIQIILSLILALCGLSVVIASIWLGCYYGNISPAWTQFPIFISTVIMAIVGIFVTGCGLACFASEIDK